MPLAPMASLQGQRESRQQPAPRLPWAQHAAGRSTVTAHDQTPEQERLSTRSVRLLFRGKFFCPPTSPDEIHQP